MADDQSQAARAGELRYGEGARDDDQTKREAYGPSQGCVWYSVVAGGIGTLDVRRSRLRGRLQGVW